MNKAILILDMPKNCNQCDLHYVVQINARCIDMCPLQFESLGNIYADLPDACPLKAIPNKKELSEEVPSMTFINGKSVDNYALGWNDCIDKILGEEDE